ncbi:DUF695 domain-containing protein [uncultured Sphingomonas sp.]|uniref:DUF695 domain-containing protein n=1 Tax=uncultured Sphingomonas sp. TaxID=158754 RepID=UPI0035C98E79
MSDGWSVTERRAEDGVFLLRARTRLPGADERAAHPLAMWITWPFEPGSGAGLDGAPDESTLGAMAAFEAAAYEALDAPGHAVGVAVLTGGAAREWLFYAADRDAFMRVLLQALEGHPSYEFEVRAWDDPSWKAARELVPLAMAH